VMLAKLELFNAVPLVNVAFPSAEYLGKELETREILSSLPFYLSTDSVSRAIIATITSPESRDCASAGCVGVNDKGDKVKRARVTQTTFENRSVRIAHAG